MIEDLLQNMVLNTKIFRDSDCYFYFGKNSLKFGISNVKLDSNLVYNITTATNDNSSTSLPFESNDLTLCKSIHVGTTLDRFVIVPSKYFDPQVEVSPTATMLLPPTIIKP